VSAPQRPIRTGVVDLLDRVVYRGAAVHGDVVIPLAGVDLLRLDLRALLTAAHAEPRGMAPATRDTVP
jgi:hypothetical protein